MLGLADGGFAVVARDVVEPDSVVVEIVQHRQAALVALSVVRLRPLGSAHKLEVSPVCTGLFCLPARVGPGHVVVAFAGGPVDVASTQVHLT